MKKRIFSSIIIFILSFLNLNFVSFADDDIIYSYSANHPFEDIPYEAWYLNSIEYVYNNNIMFGTSDTTFEPDTYISRGMLVTILYRIEEDFNDYQNTFLDVDEDMYYYDAISWANSKGIVIGYTPFEFGPNNYVTREQLLSVLHNYYCYKGYNAPPFKKTNLLTFADYHDISSYFSMPVLWACDYELIEGDRENKLHPRDYVRRSETARFLHLFVATFYSKECLEN